MIKYGVLFCCLAQCVHAHFSTLQELKTYAANYPEIVLSDNDDWFDPRYVSFFEKNRPTFFSRLRNFLGFSSTSSFNAQELKNLLERLNKRTKDLKKESDDTVQIRLKPGERAVIWGNLHGAYHSLVRDLEELHRLGMIDEQLVITNPSLYFIFLGNVVNRSPYSLEVLTVVLTLMEKNPDRVIYLKGREENDGYWENFTMRRELQYYAYAVADTEDATVPLRTTVNSFFNTLPRILQIYKDGKQPDYIYCVNYNITTQEISGTHTQAVIYGEHYADIDPGTGHSGLNFLGFMYGTSQWSLISCPVQVYQKFFNFYLDTFVIFEMGADIKQSILTAYTNDSRGPVHFKTTSYDLIFGKQLKSKDDFKNTPLFLNIPFEFGSTMDLSGAIFSLGIDVKRGIDVAIKEQNLKGGIQGYLIRPNIFDDMYVPSVAAKNIETLAYEYDIPFVLAPIGSATLLSYLEKIKNKEISVLFPVTGATVLRNPDFKYMVHFRASYADEICALIDYMIKEYKSKNFAFFYQDDAYGRTSIEAAHAELKKRGITNWLDIPYTLGQVVFKEEADKVRKSNIDTIGCFSASLPTQHFLHELGVDYLKNKHIFAMSFLVSEDLKRFFIESGIKRTFSSVVPNAFTSDLPIVKEYRKQMQENGLRIGDNSLEGWLVTELLFDALKHISPPFTQEKIINYFEGFKEYNFGGFILTFNPTTRSFDLPVLVENEIGVFVEYQKCKFVDNLADAKFLPHSAKPIEDAA